MVRFAETGQVCSDGPATGVRTLSTGSEKSSWRTWCARRCTERHGTWVVVDCTAPCAPHGTPHTTPTTRAYALPTPMPHPCHGPMGPFPNDHRTRVNCCVQARRAMRPKANTAHLIDGAGRTRTAKPPAASICTVSTSPRFTLLLLDHERGLVGAVAVDLRLVGRPVLQERERNARRARVARDPADEPRVPLSPREDRVARRQPSTKRVSSHVDGSAFRKSTPLKPRMRS